MVLLASCGAETAMKKGDKFFALGEYYDAASQYKKAYSQTRAKDKPLRGQRALKMADCYRRINYTQKAMAAYNNAVRYKQADTLSMFYLGQLQLKNGSYKEAEKTFLALTDSLGISESPHSSSPSTLRGGREGSFSPLSTLVKTGLESARMAPKWKADAALSGYEIKRQDLFNSRRAEFSPMLAGDDYDQLYFSSTRNQAVGDELSGITGTKPSDIFVSYKDEKGNWLKPETIESELNTEQDEGACCFSPDGKTMYLTVCKTDPSYPRFAQIFTSNRSDASWGKAQEFQITKDTLSLFAHPAISPDGMWLYFVSDMPGGMGGLDIWRAQLTTSGIGALENLGAPVNTPGDEMFPTFRPNGDLYFSSNGHPGMGGLDIFIAKPTDPLSSSVGGQTDSLPNQALPSEGDNNPAGVPHPPKGGTGGAYELEHPGFPLNSQGDDFGMTFEGLHNRGFFCSNRGDARGWDHIYSFEKHEVVQTVKGWVYEQDGYELPEAVVYMVGNDGTNQKLSVKGDGSFTQEIQPGIDYVFLGTCKGFLNHKEQLKVDTVKESQEYVLQFPLASITAPVLIDNIFYDFDKATLRPESTEALDKLITLLNENPHITIELSAHTDYRGSASYNQRLSQRRAESVVNYLTEHGIDSLRLTPVGYGKEKPKVIKRKLTEKYDWLKEGDVLTEEFITALKDEEKQEICNQLNRRTEFIVLRTTYGLFETLPQQEKKKDIVPVSSEASGLVE
jgi:outer membrane protein OmpA-like peptidoglycan-associated protein